MVINGNNCYFRCYYALPKSNWTLVVAEHFWEHTRLKCCLAFRRAKVTKGGNYYVVIVGRCSICQSHFKGTISERPGVNSRYVIFFLTFVKSMLFIFIIFSILVYQKIH